MKALVFALCFIPPIAYADSGRIEISSEHQRYSNGFNSAQNQTVAASLKQSTQTFYGEISDYQRGDAHDLPVQIGLYKKLTNNGRLHLEGTRTAHPMIKPEHQEYVGWYQSLPAGWTIEPGYQWTSYSRTDVEKANITIEKYSQSFRFAYAIARVTLNGERALNHRLQADWFYRDTHKLSAGIAQGKDQDVLDTGLVIQTAVNSYFLAGEHSLFRDWQMLWQVQLTDQGNIYRQQGARLGIRYQF